MIPMKKMISVRKFHSSRVEARRFYYGTANIPPCNTSASYFTLHSARLDYHTPNLPPSLPPPPIPSSPEGTRGYIFQLPLKILYITKPSTKIKSTTKERHSHLHCFNKIQRSQEYHIVQTLLINTKGCNLAPPSQYSRPSKPNNYHPLRKE